MTRRLAPLGAVLVALLAPSAAAAHVTVLPERPKLNAEQELIVRVPDEREVATTKLQILFGSDLRVGQFAPKAGWKRRVLRTGDKRVRGVEWSGGRIAPGEYADFRFLAAPKTAGQAVFRAYQTFADGRTKQWTAAPEKPGVAERETTLDEPGPSPAVDVTATPDVPAATAGAASSSPATKQTSSDAAIWLGLIAIVIALAAVLGVGWLWSTRPATLPPDDD